MAGAVNAGLVAASVVLLFLSSTSFTPLESQSIALRIAAIAILLVGPRSRRDSADSTLLSVLLLVFLPLHVLFLASATLGHAQAEGFVARLPSLGALLALALIAGRRYSPASLFKGSVAGLGIVVVAGLAVAVVAPSIGIEQGRVRGISENANTFGFTGFMLGLLIALGSRSRLSLLVLLLSMFSVALSGSRGSALSLAAGLLLMLLFSQLRKRVIGYIFLGAIFGLATSLLRPGLFADQSLLRGGNSRASSWDYARDALAQNPIFGLGYGSDSGGDGATRVAGSFFSALVQGGWIGGASVAAVIIAGSMVLRYQPSVRVWVIWLSMCLYSLAESWILSPSGPITLMFVFALLGTSTPKDLEQPKGSSRSSATDPADGRSRGRRLHRADGRRPTPGRKFGCP